MPHRIAIRARFRLLVTILATGLLAGTAACATAPPRADSIPPGALFSDAELERLVAPIALYPDDLLAVVLPASAYPLEIVQAARFLEAAADDPELSPDPDWDESVIALLNYPEVIEQLDQDLDRTRDLGQAMRYQQAAVLAAVETFRDRAYAAGNLQSDDRQTIVRTERVIEIRPAQPDILYVPYYEPRHVVIHQPGPVYHYYPRAYPVYYYPYPADHHFGRHSFWGVTSAFSIGWSTHHLHVHHHHWPSHPYFGRSYHPRYYYRRPHATIIAPPRSAPRHHAGNRWKPDPHRAGSPFRHQRNERRHVAPDPRSPRNAAVRSPRHPREAIRQQQHPGWTASPRQQARPQFNPAPRPAERATSPRLRSSISTERPKRAPIAAGARQPALGSRSTPGRITTPGRVEPPTAPRAAAPPSRPAAIRAPASGNFRHQGGRSGDNPPGRARMER